MSSSLAKSALTQTLAVPQAAVLRGAQGFYLYVVAADKSVSTRSVKPGAVDEGWVAIEGSLQPGEQVVIDGVDRLREGALVEVVIPEVKPHAAVNGAADGGRPSGGPPEASITPGERPKWMDRLPPEVAEKVGKMTPEERRAWFQKRREETGKSGTSTN